ncbi:mersacidin/lichenicidin family type 2 lantibiotic [Bacillus cereus]|uniref:mersacidin/lichenicidin family type 2 lantibiotic n=1 Tax=Bacillus cereus TaxID=1396 RepID=UPI000BF6BF0A|nr:mersacidin/lichenicidin family type 2 lantibiotic [Bacillus cereus]MEB9365927.1 mersacidin/lichenicidin family type 2 lantibiotic [Bacillus cereus]PFA19530.1 type 2 lantibiotic [Bacillus cereus]
MVKKFKFTKEELVAAWKDPQVREKSKDLPNHPSGKVLNELSEEELAEVQGASDVQVATTPMCVRLTVLPATSIKICK